MKIVLDIETVQIPKKEWAFLQGLSENETFNFDRPSESDKSQFEKDYEKTRFDGTFGKIICLGAFIIRGSDAPIEAVAWYGSDEKTILREFWQRFSKEKPELIITHNGLGFDLPFLKKRSIVNQVKPSFDLNLAKFRTSPNYDTMAVWANWDHRFFVKLDVLARVLGVETKSGSGKQIAQMWDNGEITEIADYCLQDVYVTYGCYCRMNFITPINSAIILNNRQLQRFDLCKESTAQKEVFA